MTKKLVVRLKGGLGNQMFQYASAYAVAKKNNKELIIDTYTGFFRDLVFCRKYALDLFQIKERVEKYKERLPFLLELFINRYLDKEPNLISNRPWGFHLQERYTRYYPEVANLLCDKNIWFDGYWQTEKYFEDQAEDINKIFDIQPPLEEKFLRLVKEIKSQNAILIGIRLYEEAPPGGNDSAPLSFYEKAAEHLAKGLENPVFYLFCTVREPIYQKLNLPGEIRYITHDDGYVGDLNRLWLLTNFKYQIISNSTFFWWGAWLAEKKIPNVKILACDNFHNPDSIPERWTRCNIQGQVIGNNA